MIELQAVNKYYRHEQNANHALKDINLHIGAGEIFGVVGKSGAGKSTLIRCVNLLEQPSSGKVFVNGVEFTQLSTVELRKQRSQIGMIFQHFNLMDARTVFQNIALPLHLAGIGKKRIQQRVHELLALVDLSDKANYYPAQLSGGQKQRVAIARALANEPKVLLCDEATSALDPQTTHAILQLLNDIKNRLGLTILLITHEMHVVKEICDRVAVIHNGEIIELAKIIDFFTTPKTAMAKQLIRTCINKDLPEGLRERIQPHKTHHCNHILRIFFYGHSADEPMVTTLVKKFALHINILQANIEIIQGHTIGIMIVEAIGEDKNITQGIDYLQQLKLNIEVVGYVSHD